MKKHATGCTIVLFLLGVLGLSVAPVPAWLRPVDSLHTSDPFNALYGLIFRRSEAVTRQGDGASDWVGQEPAPVDEAEDELPRPLIAVRDQAAHAPSQPWQPPARPRLEQMRKRLHLEAVPIEFPCASSSDERRPAGEGQDEDSARCGLHRFFAALEAAGAARAGAVARVVTYGDSIIASDHITDVVRQRLQERFGSAGQGFLLIARYNERQRRLRTGDATGGWQVDHIASGNHGSKEFGYVGAAFTSERVGAETTFPDIAGSRLVDLFYLAARKGGAVTLLADGVQVASVDTRAGGDEASYYSLVLPKGARRLTVRAGAPGIRLFGVTLEAPVPGVVFESLGVPGATAETWLYPDEAGFERQLGRRQPALVVTMLGGNDARALHQKRKTMQHIEQTTRAFIARIQASAPDADCLIVSPLDGADAKTSGEMRSKAEVPAVVAMQRRVAADAGCAFWDMYRAMGATGSIARWYKAGLINPDLIHPHGFGADILGELMAEALMNAYDARDLPPGSGGPTATNRAR